MQTDLNVTHRFDYPRFCCRTHSPSLSPWMCHDLNPPSIAKQIGLLVNVVFSVQQAVIWTTWLSRRTTPIRKRWSSSRSRWKCEWFSFFLCTLSGVCGWVEDGFVKSWLACGILRLLRWKGTMMNRFGMILFCLINHGVCGSNWACMVIFYLFYC